MKTLLLALAWLVPCTARAAVVRMEVLQRSPTATPGYELVTGRLHFEVDPRLPGNAIIADLDLVPRNPKGRVHFEADLRLWKPTDPARGNGAAWVEIPNRGGSSTPPAALLAQGFTILHVGWEFDVPQKPGLLRLRVPRARHPDGSPLRGVVSAQFTPDKPSAAQTLNDLEEYPPCDPEGPDSQLVVRTRAAWPGGTPIPRDRWRLDNGRLLLEGGFEPGRTYEISYLSEAPPVAGLGYAAIRDAVSWLKHDSASPAPVQRACAFGSSQCGRMLRDLVYLGFNTDEQDRIALDGMIAHVAGAGRLVLNQRWATPRSTAAHFTASYPFADSALPDPVSGHFEGLLQNPRVRHAPRIFYTNTATEYWGGGRVAALTHTTPDGTRDVAFPQNVRSYFFAGTSHGPAPFPPPAHTAGGPLADPINASATVLALRTAMDRWVASGVEPPASVHPRLSDGTLTHAAGIRYPAVPGIDPPNTVHAGGRIPNPLWPGGAGAGTELPLLVPQVDADGNDLGGIRMPDLAAPLGTAAGWVFQPRTTGAPRELVMLRGAWTPFAATRAQREATGDPRPSLEERYTSKAGFLEQAGAAIQALIDQRLLLETDREPQLKQAGERWDWVASRTADLPKKNK